MPVYQYEGQHFDLPDGLSNEQAIAKIKAHLGQATEPAKPSSSSLESIAPAYNGEAGGLADVGVNMMAALPSTIAGGLLGLGALMRGQGYEEAAKTVERTQQSNFGFGTAPPFTEAGRRMQPKVAEAFEAPGKAVEATLDPIHPLAGFSGKLLTDMAMNFLPLHGAKKAGMPKGTLTEVLKGIPSPEESMSKVRNIERALETETAPTTPVDANLEFYKAEALRKEAEAKAALEARGQRPITVDTQGRAATEAQGGMPGMVAESPWTRTVRELGVKPEEVVPEVLPRDRALVERQSPEAWKAQDTVEGRQAAMEEQMRVEQERRRTTEERQRQENAPVYSQEHLDHVRQQQEAAQAALDEQRAQLEQERAAAKSAEDQARLQRAEQAVAERQAKLEEEVAARTKEEQRAAELADWRKQASNLDSTPSPEAQAHIEAVKAEQTKQVEIQRQQAEALAEQQRIEAAQKAVDDRLKAVESEVSSKTQSYGDQWFLEEQRRIKLEKNAFLRKKQEAAAVLSAKERRRIQIEKEKQDALVKQQEILARRAENEALIQRLRDEHAASMAKQAEVQRLLDERQAVADFEVKRQATLDLNAAERQRQLAASVVTGKGVPTPKKPRGPKGQRGVIHEDLLGVGRAADFIMKTLGRVKDTPLKTIVRKYTGMFDEPALIRAYNESTDPSGKEHLIFLTPKEFKALAMQRGESHWTNKDSNLSRKMVKEALGTEKGLNSLPLLTVDKNGKITGHDGRHRMDMLDANRVDLVPVRLMHPDSVNEKFGLTRLTGEDLKLGGNKIRDNNNVVEIRSDLSRPGYKDQWLSYPEKGFGQGEIPKAVEDAYLKAKEAQTRPNNLEDPLHSFAYKQGVTKTRNAFEKAVNDAGLDVAEVTKQMDELHGGTTTTGLPFNFKKQGGGLLISPKAGQAVETLKKNKAMSDILPEMETVAETPSGVIAALNGMKDVTSNLVEKGSRLFTKGFLYEKLKTNHPLIKYTYDQISLALDTAKSQTHKMLQDNLLPKLRNLSNQEMTELHGAMLAAMKNKKALSPELLREHGFNEKQIATWKAFQEAYDNSLKHINEARAAAGMAPIDPYVGYMAGMSTGDFRTLIMKNDSKGNPHVVGIVSANNKLQLKSRVDSLLKQNPDYIKGEDKYFGNRGGKSSNNALMEAMTLLSDKDPNILAFVDEYSRMMQEEAYRYHNAAKHTMAKKGVFGMEGDKPWLSAEKNAKEGFEAQVRYIETMSKWAELSKATGNLKEVLSDPGVQQAHPNAVAMSKEYISNALGYNTSKIGQSLNNLVSAIGESTGLGPHYFNTAIHGVKGGLNTVFFALRPTFLIANFLQGFIKTPTMINLLRSRGMDVGKLTTTGHLEYMKAGLDGLQHIWGKDTEFSKKMWEYGHEHGISTTQIFEHSTDIRKGFGHYKNAILEAGMAKAESVPRSMMYAMFSNILRKNGFANHPDIFKIARELTDIAMADYRPHEAQRANQMLGPAAPLLGNLSTYAANENSTLALLAREAKNKGSVSPILAAALTGLVVHGMLGFPGFKEADYLFEKITGWMGKPRTLTDVILTNTGPQGKLGDTVALGLPAAAGIDTHNILGRSSILPAIAGGGGAGAAVDIAAQAIETARNPSEMNAKRLAYLANPIGGLKGPMELEWFSKQTPQGNLALDRRVGHAGEGTYMRNEFDVKARMAGLTSAREFKSKEQMRQQMLQDMKYKKIQDSVVQRFFDKQASSKGVTPDDLRESLDSYVAAEGDPNKFITEMTKHGIAMNTSAVQRYLLQKAQSGDMKSALALKRWQEKTYAGAE